MITNQSYLVKVWRSSHPGFAVALVHPGLESPIPDNNRSEGPALGVVTRLDIQDLYFQEIAWFGSFDKDRPRHNVPTIAGAGGTTERNILPRRVPKVDIFHGLVALDHLVVIFARVERDRLDRDRGARRDGQHGLQGLRKVSPMNILFAQWQGVVGLAETLVHDGKRSDEVRKG